MGLRADAASGQGSDNAGKAKGGLDDAITAAFDASGADDISSLDIEESPKSEAKVKAKAKAKAETEDEPDENAGDDAPSEDAEASEASEESAEVQPLSAPKHWPEDDKKAFAKMTREGQEIALKLAKNLEGGFTRKSQELSDKAKYADSVRGLIGDQRRASLQAQGIDEMAYIRRLNDIYAKAEADPVGYLKWAMQSMGVKPEQLGISQATPQTSPNGQSNPDDDIARLLADPKVAQLEAELQSLKGIIDKEQESKQQAQRAQHVNAVNTLNTTIRGFREALDEGGQLRYPHFDALMVPMGALMDSHPKLANMSDGPEKMALAYKMAERADPDLGETVIQSEAQRQAIEAQKKRDAQRAKSITSVKPAAGVVSTKPKTNSLDDALSQAMSKHGL